jgi:4'-phosphopantetheinyl transferase
VAPPILRFHHRDTEPALPATAAMLTLLDRTERQRAERHATPARAASFVTGRYLLRLFAADLLSTEPGALVSDFRCPVCARTGHPREARPDHGRPGYLLRGDRVRLALSLSRSADAVLLGALDLRDPHGDEVEPCDTETGVASTGTAGRNVRGPGSGAGIGVDVDAVGGVVFEGFDDVALSEAERERIAVLPRHERNTERARLWVRKEALVKARGTGFGSVGPADVEAPAHPGVTDLEECDGVTLARLGLVAAVAVL